ncbi:MAG: hypothetical protein Q7T41_04220 [Candidatus Saccharibacteria bacterium]|nr:hypothetical protein [Candidatus Saccharibacteria bacterium]
MSNEILTSAGSVGAERRSFDRFYVTAHEPVESAGAISDVMSRLRAATDRRSRISRSVLRVVTNFSTVSELAEQGMCPEVAIPLDQHDGPDSLLAIYAHNYGARAQTIVPIDQMVEETRAEEDPATSAFNTDEFLAENNLSITNLAGPAYHKELFEMWGDTFGWTREQVAVFCRTILNQNPASVQDARVWFSCAGAKTSDGYPLPIASSAMAERIDIQGFNKIIHLVESTEWRTRQIIDGQPKGLIVPVLQRLNQQILRDLPEALIVAECNFASRADRRGHQAGFVIPSRELARQILRQNVGVHDSKGDWPLRDFTAMVLSNAFGAQQC